MIMQSYLHGYTGVEYTYGTTCASNLMLQSLGYGDLVYNIHCVFAPSYMESTNSLMLCKHLGELYVFILK